MEVRVLGPVEVLGERGPVEVTAPMLRRLLAVLVLAGSRGVSVVALTDALWGGHPPPSAGKLVQVYVSRLRGLLPAGASVKTLARGYALDLSEAVLDRAVFEELVGEGRDAMRAGNPALGMSLLQRALRLWRGDPYGEFSDEEFAREEARRLTELRMVAIEERFEAELALGRHGKVLPELTASAAANPGRERLQGQLMVGYYRCGRQKEALEVYAATRAWFDQELGLEVGPELRELQRRILRHEIPPPADIADGRAARSAVGTPVPPTPLIGRRRELAELRSLVQRPDVGLVTLAGAGGTGKTRLALALIEAVSEEFANGALFMELAPLRDTELVMSTIAHVVGVTETARASLVDSVATWLASREVLLVIDNVEHLAGVGPLLARLAGASSRSTVLLTSRRVMHLSGEHVFPVLPLGEDDAVEVFVQRARALNPSFRLTHTTEPLVRDICQRLDGLALAIELAAARTDVLTPQLLLERLDSRLTVLTAGPRDLPARQQTLRETLDWSAALLLEDQRRAFARLSVFAGGWTLVAGGVVANAELDDLSTLVADNLVQRRDSGDEPRFFMLETIREYARELLGQSEELEQTGRAHEQYFLDFVESADTTGSERATWLARFDLEIDNLRAAMDWAQDTGDDLVALRIATGLYRFFYVRGRLGEGIDRISRPLDRGAGEATLRASALRALAGLLWLHGDHDAAEVRALSGLRVAESCGNLDAAMGCSTVLGLLRQDQARFDEAHDYFEGSGRIAERLGSERDVLIANTNQAHLAFERGDLDEAQRRWRQTFDAHRHRGDDGELFAALGLADIALAQNRVADAHRYFTHVLSAARRQGFTQQIGNAWLGLAAVAFRRGHPQKAARYLGRAAATLEHVDARPSRSEAELRRRTTEETRRALGESAFQRAFDAGRVYRS